MRNNLGKAVPVVLAGAISIYGFTWHFVRTLRPHFVGQRRL
jgi:hypothetical protein